MARGGSCSPLAANGSLNLAVLALKETHTRAGGGSKKRGQKEGESVAKYFNKARKEMMGERAQSAPRYYKGEKERSFSVTISVAAAEKGKDQGRRRGKSRK